MSHTVYVREQKIIATFTPWDMMFYKEQYIKHPTNGRKLGPFFVMKEHIDLVKKIEDYDEQDEEIKFCISTYSEGIYCIPKDVICADYNIFIDEKCFEDPDGSLDHFPLFFKKARGYPYKHILEVLNSDLHIGYEEGCLTPAAVNEIIKRCPSESELDLYVNSRISSVVASELDVKDEYYERYKRLLNRKQQRVPEDYIEYLNDLDIERLKSIQNTLSTHLKNQDWTESTWEKEILKILPVLFPQYIFIKNKVCLGTYGGHKREADFVLINSSGYIDLMEIKRPDTRLIGADPDHSHHIYQPSKEVSNAATQLENYIYYLNKYQDDCIKNIKKRVNELPEKFDLKISNPRGLLLLGNSSNYSPEQKHTLQLIRTQYSNIVDLITYDDLVDRIGYTIKVLESKQ